jgi:hypothetical protein
MASCKMYCTCGTNLLHLFPLKHTWTHLVEVTKPLHKVIRGVRDLLPGDGLQHGQELLKGHPRVLLGFLALQIWEKLMTIFYRIFSN